MGTTFEDFLASGGEYRYFLQPLRDIHLHSHLERELEPGGSVAGVYALATVALCILLIACINFINLVTARTGRRSLEVGMRKTLGAEPGQVGAQFLFEAFLTSFLAAALAIPAAVLLLDRVNALFGSHLDASFLREPGFLGGAAARCW